MRVRLLGVLMAKAQKAVARGVPLLPLPVVEWRLR
jgi:hypothetical protein